MSKATLYHEYSVSERNRGPLLEFILSALETCGCRVLFHSRPDRAPFRVTFETPLRERLGIVVYAFLANDRRTKNRPADEHRFQVKYGSKDGLLHELWQDTFGLYTTLFVGIDPDRKIFVGADPVLHSPTRFFISIEFKRRNVEQVLEKGWSVWEREKKKRADENPIEVLVGGRPEDFLRFVRFERAALGEDQGHRALVAERIEGLTPKGVGDSPSGGLAAIPIHALAREFALGEREVLDLVAGARRLKMAVRGWVAEEHLLRALRSVPGVTDCVRLDEEGGPDLRLRFELSRPLEVECKNVLRQPTAAGLPRVDFMRTRASKTNPCSRFYSPADFDVVAACLHARTERWDFSFIRSAELNPHKTCEGKLANNVHVDERWQRDAAVVLREAAKG